MIEIMCRLTCANLQSASINDSVVDGELTTFITKNKNSNAAATLIKGIGKTLQQTALVNDRKTLLDIASLGHGNNVTIITNIQDTVLLENGTVHLLYDDRGGGVGDEGWLLLQLLGEEVNTKVTVLASLRRRGDTDDLAGTALKVQQIANTDVVAGDRHGSVWARTARWTTGSWHGVYGSTFLNNVVNRLGLMVLLVVLVVTRSVNRVEDTVSSAVKSVTERVVLAFVVVISHIRLGFLWGVDGSTGLGPDSYLFSSRWSVVVVSNRSSLLVVVVCSTVLMVLNVYLSVDVTLVRFTIAEVVSEVGLSEEGKQRCGREEESSGGEYMDRWGGSLDEQQGHGSWHGNTLVVHMYGVSLL
jgi:hypothetical protein